MQVYELAIQEWHAVIPAEWPLELGQRDGTFASVAGTTIKIVKGTHLRGGPKEVLDRMLSQGFIKEVNESSAAKPTSAKK